MRTITDRQRLTLKAATRRAVDMAGGGDAFQHVSRVRAANLSKYGSTGPDNETKFMPIDVAVEADIEAGSPIILTAMAEMLGYALTPLAGTSATGPVTLKDGLRIGIDAGAVLEAIDRAVEDGVIDAAEQRDIAARLETMTRTVRCVARRNGR